jgi:hypothetical protein
MAESDKIKSQDIIQKDLFANTIESATQLTEALEGLEKELIKTAEAQAKIAKQSSKDLTAENLEKTTKAISQASEARERANQIQKERLKLEQRLKIATSTAIDQNTELKVQIQEQNKINKELAKEKLGLVSIYQKESKRLNDLRKKYKDLALTEKVASKETKDLLKEIQSLDKRLKDIDASVGQFQRSVGDYSKQALGATKQSIALGAAIVGLNGDFGDLKKGFEANEEGSKELNNLTAQAGAIFNTFANRAGKAGTELVAFFKDVASGEKSLFDFSETAVNVANSFNGVIEAAGQAAEAAGIASDETFVFQRELLSLNETLVTLNGEFEKYNAIAGDSTRTFDEQQEAAEKAQRINIKRLAVQEDISKRELQIIQDRIKATEDDANRLALETEATEKRIALQEIQNELNLATIENERLLREIQRDRFERELDFAIDAFDAQKTINERQIADERKTIQEREDLFNETVRLADKSFKSQKDLFAEFVDDKLDFDALVAETDEEAIRRTIRKLDLDDVELGRALEVIKERKLALQDIDDLEREIFDAKVERFQRDKDAQDAAKLNNLETELELTNNLSEQFRIRKKLLEKEAQFELENAELTAEERKQIQSKLNNDLILLEKERIETIAEFEEQNRRDIIDARLETAKGLSDLTKLIAGENKEAQRAALIAEKAVATSEILINLQREISDIRRNNAEADTPEKNAPQIAAATTTAFAGLAAVASQSFFDGTENTGNGGKVDDRGGFYAVLHPNERVMTARQNAKVGELTNNELADIALMYNKGELINPFTDMAINVTQPKEKDNTNYLLAQKLDILTRELRNKPVSQFAFDSLGNLIETRYRNGVKDLIKYKSKKAL